MTMMKCGHAANAYYVADNQELPSCVICDCREVVESPNLEGRTARCSYYGKRGGRNWESHFGPRPDDGICRAEVPSSEQLPFFSAKDGEFDSYYCGCWGWD